MWKIGGPRGLAGERVGDMAGSCPTGAVRSQNWWSKSMVAEQITAVAASDVSCTHIGH